MKKIQSKIAFILILVLGFSQFATANPKSLSFNEKTLLTYAIVDTMQDKCYDNSKEITSPKPGDAFYGQDAQFLGNQASYTKSKDGLTVKDEVTGLTWQKSYEKPIFGGKYYWAESQKLINSLNKQNYGGYDDWRLPTIKELYSLWNASVGWPYIDTNYFDIKYTDEQDLSHAIFWSCDKYTGVMGNTRENTPGVELAFGVNFGTGHIKAYSISIGPKHFVRCVRGNPTYSVNLFQNNNDGTILDLATGLMWQQTDNGSGIDWEHALAYVKTQNNANYLGHNDWRLPNTKELQSIVDYTRSPYATNPANVGPAINALFSCTGILNDGGKADYPYYWTSTSVIQNPSGTNSYAWYVAFGQAEDGNGEDIHGAGAIRFDKKIVGSGEGEERVNNYVRLVRSNSVEEPQKVMISYPIVDSMQDKCYGNTKEISSPKSGEAFYGQDAQFLGNQASYTKSSDSLTVIDNVTGLTWQSSPDTNFDGSLTATDKLTWEKAQVQAKILNSKNFGGYNDWRLPSIKELYSLIDFRGTDPSGPDSASPKPFIDTNYFTFMYGDTSKGERIIDSQWASSNLYTGQAMNSEGGKLFGVNFADGRIKGYGLKMPSRPPGGGPPLLKDPGPPGPGGGDKTFFVLCVRGNPKYGINQLVNNQDQTITDQATGFMWSKSDNGKAINWEEALTWVQAKNKENYLGHNDWRLPNAKELQSIVDYGRNPDATNSPAIDPLFSCTKIKNEAGQDDYPWYWTGTTHISANGMGAAAIYLCFGRATGYMNGWADVHGAGAQRSDPKSGDPAQFPKGRGPQGDGIRIYNYVRLVRGETTLKKPGDEPGDKPGDNPGGQGSQYTLEQAMSDNAQLSTIAFNGLAFITGSSGADTFFPPGKVADFFGFQYMRDVDTAGYGHNTTFLSRVANNVLYILNDAQKAKLIALAKEQAPIYTNFAYNRFPLMNAFRKSLEGKEPTGSTGLNQQLVGKYTANLYLYDAELSYNRALVVGGIISSFTDEQKAYLAKMEFNNYKSWPDVKEDETLKKSMNNNEFVAVMTYASELFSWYKGGVDPDVYFCPERHGTYFGGFFMKDYPAMNDPNYFISTDITGESGKAFLAILDTQQRPLVEGIINEQRANLNEIAKIRTTVVTEMRKAMSGGTMDKEKVFALIKRYGELDGLLSGLYASRFAAINKTLTQTQRTALIKLRNLDVVPQGAYRFSSPVAMPELPNNDYLFGVGTFPADAGQTKAPTSFGETKDDNRPPPGDRPPGGPKNYTDSAFDGTIVLGSPTNTQVTANITANQTFFVRLEWGEKTNEYNQKSDNAEASNLKPAVIIMNNLQPNKTYYYRLFFKSATDKGPKTTMEYTFQTPRNLGASYSFVVQSDSHLLNKADKEIYAKSMQTMASYKPDFMFDLGDTFLNDQVAKPQYQSYETIRQTSFQQRAYLDNVTRSAYLFLTIGNHEGEYGYFLDGTDKNLTVMSTLARKTYYPNPEPNEFYSGNTTREDFVGLPQNYYAFQWGDALYVSIDYYRYMKTEPFDFKDGWTWTLGKTQYDWFRKTLEESTAKYKFVFSHHEGGLSRGGAVLVKFFEWGGYDKNGKYLFDQKRPGWGKPIQQVMKDTGVTIFFQGHDHLFAREVVDSVVYQTLPKPAEKIPDQQNNFGTYPKADLLLNSGFVKVDVSPLNVTVSYFRNYFVSSEPQEGNTGIVYSYTVDSAHNVKVTLPKKDDVSKYGGTPDGGSGKDKEKKESKKDITIEIDGKEIKSDPSPILDSNGRIQVPLRLIAENLGCSVLWQENGKKNSITIKKTGVVIELMVGSKNALINGQTKSMDSAPFVQNGRTFVPLRFVGEAIGVTIEWDSVNKIVRITTKPTPPTEDITTDSVNNIILGCPTDNSILGKAIADFDMDSYLVYGKQPGLLSEKSKVISSKAGDMIGYNLTNLAPDTQYYYQRMYRKIGTLEYKVLQTGQFHTQRKWGSKFVFTIQADPHRDENSDLPLYETALKNILADLGDFHIDLGDTFMGEKLGRTKEGTLKRYLEDRAYFAKITSAVPLFLVNGNHDGECGWNQQKSSENIAIWASTNRLKLFPSPTPGSFYSGSMEGAGNYYSYTWGDALFITLDPYWFTEKKAQGNEDGWNYTLGKTQYDWLKNTLETSHAKFKFVFIHNLVGGYGKDSRGGAEAAKFFEWGGSNFDGSYGFDQKRSGWGKPIHQLLVENHVSAVFHGHDHFYAKQELDGIIYQLVPQPSHPGSDVRNASEYSYLKGLFLPPAGHLRVSVSSSEVKVEYVKASLGQTRGIIADSYTIPLSKSLLNTHIHSKGNCLSSL